MSNAEHCMSTVRYIWCTIYVLNGVLYGILVSAVQCTVVPVHTVQCVYSTCACIPERGCRVH